MSGLLRRVASVLMRRMHPSPAAGDDSTVVHGPGGRRIVVLAAVLAIAGFVVRTPRQLEYDSFVIFEGIQELLRWLASGREGQLGQIGPFPPFQYLTGLIAEAAYAMGVRLPTSFVWTSSSSLSFGGLAVLTFQAVRRRTSPQAAWLAVGLMLSGPFVTYCTSTYNELPAALLTAGLVVAAAGAGGPGACAALFVASALTKETAVPLLALAWVGALFARPKPVDRAEFTRHAAALLAAVAGSLVVHAAFNLLRFGVPWNAIYLGPGMLVHRWDHRLLAFLGLWFAPNGGLWVFATGICLAITVLGVYAIARFRRQNSLRALVPAAAGVAILAVATMGLSAWHSPFGWWCWGPRLMLPWLPAVLLLVILAEPDFFERCCRWVTRGRRRVIASFLMFVLALPHALSLSDAGIFNWFFAADVAWRYPADQANSEPVQAVRRHLTWTLDPLMIAHPLRLLADPTRAWPAVLYSAAVAALLWAGRPASSDSRQAVAGGGFPASQVRPRPRREIRLFRPRI
ncbi:MAG: hypothetical protein NZ561_00440 [Phycisphaerae bacterium]|nr:hypothetical protein [Phycisphaerae bacterium]MDW8262252.1 hypothetical protein [Phycisphaerales bacterium]